MTYTYTDIDEANAAVARAEVEIERLKGEVRAAKKAQQGAEFDWQRMVGERDEAWKLCGEAASALAHGDSDQRATGVGDLLRRLNALVSEE